MKTKSTQFLFMTALLGALLMLAAPNAEAQNYTAQVVGGAAAPSTATYFSVPLCSNCGGMGGNDSETYYTVALNGKVNPLPTDANYQINCTLITDGNGAAINITNKTAASFGVTVNNSYTNRDNNPTMSLDCMYHHS